VDRVALDGFALQAGNMRRAAGALERISAGDLQVDCGIGKGDWRAVT
jgi:hypothetical protein